jgi:hypothetical protein
MDLIVNNISFFREKRAKGIKKLKMPTFAEKWAKLCFETGFWKFLEKTTFTNAF